MQALGITETGDQPIQERLRSYLRDKQLLLLLDNFEQVVDAAPIVAELLAGCPQLNVLVTSRVPLHVRGEKEIAVSPLALPPTMDDRRPMTDDAPSDLVSSRSLVITQYAAVQLFIQRALDVQPTFTVTNANAPAVAEICYRVDGLPLAIELAAARIKLFAPEALLARLINRLALLTGGARDLPARQQTLRAAIDWSYDLLDARAQTLFTHLGVFVGGCTLEAATLVCNGNGDQSPDMLDRLELLVESSLLVRVNGADGELRFGMLATIREYALERLEASGEAEALRRRHAEYFLTLAEAAEPHLNRADAAVWLNRLETEHDNLRAALAWSRESIGDKERGLRLVAALGRFWELHGYYNEGMQWCIEFLTQVQTETPARLPALLGAGWLALWQLALPHAQAYATEALALARLRADQPAIAAALRLLGNVAQRQDDEPRALAYYEQSLAASRKLGDPAYIAPALMELGTIIDWPAGLALFEEALTLARVVGNPLLLANVLLSFGGRLRFEQNDTTPARVQTLLEEASLLFRTQGDRGGYAATLQNLGALMRDQGNYARATTLLEEGLALTREMGSTDQIAEIAHDLSETAFMQGDAERAVALEQEVLAIWRGVGHMYTALPALNLAYLALQRGDVTQARALLTDSFPIARKALWSHWWVPWWVAALASLAAAQGNAERAARLFGAAEAFDEVPPRPAHRREIARHVAAVRAQLDDSTFAAAWAAGQSLTLEQAIAYALGEGDEAAERTRPG